MKSLMKPGAFFDKFFASMKRFPLSHFCALFVTVLLVRMVYDYHLEEELAGYIFAGVFAFFLSLATDVYLESTKAKASPVVFARLGVVVVSVLIYVFYTRYYADWSGVDVWRYLTLNLLAILLYLIVPYMNFDKKGEKNFWRSAHTFLFVLLQTFVYFLLLFLGIALLYASIDYLFDVRIDGELYGATAAVIFGFLASSFFLASVPQNFSDLTHERYYPKALGVFEKFFVIPLVIAYFVVLYVYSASIVFTWDWPLGGVAGWIIGFSFIGVFAWFFSFDVDSESEYVKVFRKWFFPVLIPLTFVLFVAVGWRIMNYGVTEPRYFGVLFGIWLFVSAAYYSFYKRSDLRALVVSLILFLIFGMFGPYNAFSASRSSQLARLDVELRAMDLIDEEGHLIFPTGSFDWGDRDSEIYSIITYLGYSHGIEVFDSLLSGQEVSDVYALTEKLGLSGMNNYYSGVGNSYFTMEFPENCWDYSYTNEACFYDVEGFSQASFSRYIYEGGDRDVNLGEGRWLSLEDGRILLVQTGVQLAAFDIEKDALDLLVKNNFNRGSVNVYDSLVYVVDTPALQAELRVMSVNGSYSREDYPDVKELDVDSVSVIFLQR